MPALSRTINKKQLIFDKLKSIVSCQLSVARKTKGFTLIELLVVITIVSITSAIVASVNTNFQKKARDAVRKRDLSDIQIGMRLYYNNKGHYPVQTILGIQEGFIFGCEDFQPDISLWTKIYPGNPWICTDDQYPVTYMKLYPKEPIPWKPSGWALPAFLNYVYIPTETFGATSGFCNSNLACQGYRLYACLESLDDPDADGPAGAVIEQSVSCPPDRVPYLVGPD